MIVLDDGRVIFIPYKVVDDEYWELSAYDAADAIIDCRA